MRGAGGSARPSRAVPGQMPGPPGACGGNARRAAGGPLPTRGAGREVRPGGTDDWLGPEDRSLVPLWAGCADHPASLTSRFRRRTPDIRSASAAIGIRVAGLVIAWAPQVPCAAGEATSAASALRGIPRRERSPR